MTHDSRAVANYFLRKAAEGGRTLTPVEAIKLVYIAHGWSLGLYDKPLIDDPVQARAYGPIVQPVFDAFKRFGTQPITEMADVRPNLGDSRRRFGVRTGDEFTSQETDLLNRIWEVYGPLKGYELSGITNSEDGPWQSQYKTYGDNATIPNQLIGAYFKELKTENAV